MQGGGPRSHESPPSHLLLLKPIADHAAVIASAHQQAGPDDVEGSHRSLVGPERIERAPVCQVDNSDRAVAAACKRKAAAGRDCVRKVREAREGARREAGSGLKGGKGPVSAGRYDRTPGRVAACGPGVEGVQQVETGAAPAGPATRAAWDAG
jgi:hypothetical protein